MLRSDAARHLLAGAVAGVVSNTAVAPIDIVRLNLMTTETKTNALRVTRSIFAGAGGGLAGVGAFWQGNSADVVRTIPASAIRFYTFALYKGWLPGCLLVAGITAPALCSLLAGGFAGMTATAALFPLETVRTRMAVEGALKGTNIVSYSAGIMRADGLAGLYRGLTPSLLSVLPYFGVRFGVYDILKTSHYRLIGSNVTSSKVELPAEFSAAYGFLSGLAASALTFPVEVVRRRAMLGTAGPNLFRAVPAIVAKEGFSGLYKGYAMNLIKVAPSSAITFLVYETVRGSLDSFANPRPKPPKPARRAEAEDGEIGKLATPGELPAVDKLATAAGAGAPQ